MAKFCTNCGAPMDDAAGFCSKCGKASVGAPPPPPAGGAYVPPATGPAMGGLADNVAGMLAYVTIIPAIIFLVVEPYNRNRFVRFHSFQCIFVAIAWVVLHIAIGLLPFIHFMLWGLLDLIGLILWVVLLLKAYQGEKFKLPVVGDMAEKQADAI
jgi:uncharacterized membrane protein